MMYRLILLIYMLSFPSNAQQSVDSLKNLVYRASGEEKVDLLVEIIDSLPLGNIDERIIYADEALLLSERIHYDLGKMRALTSLGQIYYYSKEYEEALKFLGQAESLAISQKNKKYQGIALINKGNIYDDLNKRDSAQVFHQLSYNLLEQVDDKMYLAEAATNLALNYWRWAQYKKALHFHSIALDIRQQLGMTYETARSHNNLGVTYWRLGKYEDAVDHYLAAYHIQDSIENKVSLCLISNNLARIFLEMKRYRDAKSYCLNAQQLAREADYTFGIAYSYQSYGKFFEAQNNLDSALVYYQKAMEIHDSLNQKEHYYAEIRMDLGRTHQLQHNYDKAKEYFIESLALCNELNDRDGASEALRYLGLIALQENDLAQSSSYFNRSLQIAEEDSVLPRLRDIYYSLHELELKKKNSGMALLYYKKFIAARDSILNKQSEEMIAELLTKYETERKELENVKLRTELERESIIIYFLVFSAIFVTLLLILLINRFRIKTKLHAETLIKKEQAEKLNSSLEDQKNILSELNAMKDKFFSIISHDLKNPFQALLGLAEILDTEYDSLSEQNKQTFISSIHQSSRYAYNLLENLLQWSRAQSGKLTLKPRIITINDIIEDTSGIYLSSLANKNITFINNIAPKQKAYADYQTVYTIFRNLISNAVKFTNTGGTITLSSEVIPDFIRIKVSDDGVGMTKDQVSNLFTIDTNSSSVGTSEEKGTGLGLILCKEFTDKNNGRISVESEPMKGSTFIVDLPLPFPNPN